MYSPYITPYFTTLNQVLVSKWYHGVFSIRNNFDYWNKVFVLIFKLLFNISTIFVHLKNV